MKPRKFRPNVGEELTPAVKRNRQLRRARVRKMGLSPRQFTRRWFRGEFGSEEVWTGLALFGEQELMRQQRAFSSAQQRLQQNIWLVMKRTEMENRLEGFGIPRDCWQQLFWWTINQDEPYPLREGRWILNGNARPFCFADWLRTQPDKIAHEAFWAAGVAWAAAWARKVTGREQRFRIGRILEASMFWLELPARDSSIREDAVSEATRVRSSSGGRARVEQRRRVARFHEDLARKRWQADITEHRTSTIAKAILSDPLHVSHPEHSRCDRRLIEDHIRHLNPNR